MREAILRAHDTGFPRRPPRQMRARYDRRGSAAVELAVIVALLIGGAIAVWYLTGDSARQTYGRLATRLATAPDLPNPRAAGVGTRRAQAAHVASGGAGLRSRVLWVVAWCAALGVGCLAWFLFRHRGRRKDRPPAEAPQAQGILESVPADQRDRLFRKRQQIFRILSRQPKHLFQNRVEVRQLMTPNLLTVRPATTVEEMAATMKDHRTRHLLVCDKGGRLRGIVSDRDLNYRAGKTAAELMTPDPLTVSPSTPAAQVITTLLDRHISCMPVVEDDRLCGVLTTTDLMMSLQCALQILATLAAEMQSAAEPKEAVCA